MVLQVVARMLLGLCYAVAMVSQVVARVYQTVARELQGGCCCVARVVLWLARWLCGIQLIAKGFLV